MRWLGIRVRSRTARTSCCCETAATTPLVLANTEVGSMSGVITIDTGARSAVTAATGRTAGPAGRTESAVQHDTKSAATAARCIGRTRVCAGAATSGMDTWKPVCQSKATLSTCPCARMENLKAGLAHAAVAALGNRQGEVLWTVNRCTRSTGTVSATQCSDAGASSSLRPTTLHGGCVHEAAATTRPCRRTMRNMRPCGMLHRVA